MKRREIRYLAVDPRGAKNALMAANDAIGSVPPIDIGFDIEYITTLSAATNRPNAMRDHMYGPPSSVKVDRSSAVSNAYGMKNAMARNASQVNACAPLDAAVPIVSTPTSVQ